MKHSLIIIFTILFAGCTINLAPSQEQVEKKVPAQIEMKQAQQSKHAPWPQEGKEYWYARYFFTMASNPDIQRMLKPAEVFAIVKCTMKIYEEDNSWEWFLSNMAEIKILTPKTNQYVYQTTKFCAAKQKAKNSPLQGVRDTI
jgi:hypothetical protein